LRTVPGAQRDDRAADAAYAERPVYAFGRLHPEGFQVMMRHGWNWLLPCTPWIVRMFRQVAEARESSARVAPRSTEPDPEALTQSIRQEAERLGLSQVGFTAFDPRYVTTTGAEAPEAGEISQGTVIVCLLEQDWAQTQAAPNAKCERTVMRTYADLIDRSSALTTFLHKNGIHAQLHNIDGAPLVIPYAVQAGLGQLGLNGQLLTPTAGSRCRIAVITTNATLVHGEPIDFGVHAICDACQLCVKRCPPGAIPLRRRPHRGVEKAAIKPERCLPTVSQAHGCAVCMKVCPVQRYGLAKVVDHMERTGTILGKGTDELEGFDWIDGYHYGPDKKPRINTEFLRPMGIALDPNRVHPPGVAPAVVTSAGTHG
jgi:ferredoxin